jgi:hypothetical protein
VPEGKIVTLYSYTGAPESTMALANVAWIMASNGLKVLMVDCDLDSPGLHNFFHPFLDQAQIVGARGVIDIIIEYALAATREEERPADWYVRYAQLTEHAVSLTWPDFPEGGALDYVSAGQRNREYLPTIDWDYFYGRLEGGLFFDEIRKAMKRDYDYVLIDSPAGHTDITNICTVHLPDILVDCFTLSSQSVGGAAEVATKVATLYRDRNIRVLPVAMQIVDAEKEKLEVGLAWARTQFGSLPMGLTEEEAAKYWAEVQIPYRPFYAFEETLAAFGDVPGSLHSLLAAFERLTAAITENRICKLPPMAEETRLRYLDEFTRRRLPSQTGVYLSYVPEDRIWADWIAAVLGREGIRVRHAEHTASADGGVRKQAARDADAASKTVILMSAAYSGSQQALGVADAMAKREPIAFNQKFVPVRVTADATGSFAERTVIDLTGRTEDQATEDLYRAFGLPAPSPVLPDEAAGPRFPGAIPPV